MILEAAEKADIQIRKAILINLGEGIVAHGDSAELRAKYHLDAASVASEAIKHLSENNE